MENQQPLSEEAKSFLKMAGPSSFSMSMKEQGEIEVTTEGSLMSLSNCLATIIYTDEELFDVVRLAYEVVQKRKEKL